MSRPSPLPAPVTATVRWFALATTTSFTTVPLSKDQPAFEAASCTKALSSVRTDRLGGARIKTSRLIGCNPCLIGTAVLGLRVERYHLFQPGRHKSVLGSCSYRAFLRQTSIRNGTKLDGAPRAASSRAASVWSMTPRAFSKKTIEIITRAIRIPYRESRSITKPQTLYPAQKAK